MRRRHAKIENVREALRQVRKPVPAPTRIKQSKKLYVRAREREKILADVRTS